MVFLSCHDNAIQLILSKQLTLPRELVAAKCTQRFDKIEQATMQGRGELNVQKANLRRGECPTS